MRATVTSDLDDPIDLQALPWPDVGAVVGAPRGQPRSSPSATTVHPTGRCASIGTGSTWTATGGRRRRIAADLLGRAPRRRNRASTRTCSTDGLDRLFGDDAGTCQRRAAAAAVRRRLAVVAGGPGTGKTTTVARILALLDEQAAAAGRSPPRVALAAPTGKAAARLQEAVHAEAAPTAARGRGSSPAARGCPPPRCTACSAGARAAAAGSATTADNRLPHDVVVVDETSMVSLSLMARLVEAVRPDARLVLVGDPDQLASVEAGAVLGDIVGPALGGDRRRGSPIGDGIVVLREVHRFGGRDRRAGGGDPARRRDGRRRGAPSGW